MSEDPFRPHDVDWQAVSPRLATALRIVIGGPALIVLIVAVALAIVLPVPAWARGLLLLLAVIALATIGWVLWWAPRHQRSIAYAEQADDLLVTSGIMFRRLVAIPYGRMQFVDVSAGPLDRWLGIASVTLYTASTETAATVHGLPADEARRLRNRLTELGEARSAGI